MVASETNGEGPRRRRRRRRRRGEEASSAPDDPTDTIIRCAVREPRQGATEVVGIDGSTRMEAKRQRRREGREAGRRRTPVLSEAEFLARRESVVRKMIIRQRREPCPDRGTGRRRSWSSTTSTAPPAASLIGNVYLGRVQNVLPSMEAAFVDIGRGRNGVIYAGRSTGTISEPRARIARSRRFSSQARRSWSRRPRTRSAPRAPASPTTSPSQAATSCTRRAATSRASPENCPESERRRLKEVLSDLVGDSASVIVRTAAEGASEEELIRDVNRLKAQWEDIERKVAAGNAPQLLYAEPDLTVRIVRDLFTEDFSELIISGNGGITDAYDSVEAYVSHVAPHLKDRAAALGE